MPGRMRAGRAASAGLAALLAAAVATAVTPSAASAAASTCVGAGFTSSPGPGRPVRPGQRIVYRVRVVVAGGDEPVLGCSRDVLVSPLLEFVSVEPAGAFFPGTSAGPMVGVNFAGPVAPGTVLRGRVTMRVRADAPAGSVVVSSSGPAICHVVVPRCRPFPWALARGGGAGAAPC